MLLADVLISLNKCGNLIFWLNCFRFNSAYFIRMTSVDKSLHTLHFFLSFGTSKLQLFQTYSYKLLNSQICRTAREGEPDYLSGNTGSVAACNRKRGSLNYCMIWRRNFSPISEYSFGKSSSNLLKINTWYSSVLIELFQISFSSLQRSDTFGQL